MHFCKFIFLFFSFLITTQVSAQTHSLNSGWSLVGNDAGAGVDPNAVFGNATTPTSISTNVTTVWTWNNATSTWNFFAPSMTPSALSTYATSKGYGVLSTIQAGEGFWVNVNGAASGGSATSVNLAASPMIVGTWYDGNTNDSVITFFANGDYMQAKSVTTDAGATAGIEHSTYTWNSTTGAFAPVCPAAVDTNGLDGFCNGSSATTFTLAFINSNTILAINSHNQSGTLTRVVDATNPLVGTWYNLIQNGVAPSFGTPTSIAITFFANGDYVQAQSVTSGTGSQPGLEHGTYTWNSSTGAFTVACPTIDTNGLAGFSAVSDGVQCTAGSTVKNTTLSVSGNTLTINNQTTFTRVTP